MRKIHTLRMIAEEGGVQVYWLGLDESEWEKGVLTNQYLVVNDGKGLLVDPGGIHVFDRMLELLTEIIDPLQVEAVFYSHQDPDVVASVNLVLDTFPHATIYVPELWVRFLPHLGPLAGVDVKGIPDNGGSIQLSGHSLKAVPAHFLHSPGNFSLYEPRTRTLFSGDIGGAMFPEGIWYLYVEDFEEHTRYMEGFHRRLMASPKAIKAWTRRVRGLIPERIAPQHGAIFEGKETVARFLEWLDSLDRVGVDFVYS